MKTFSETEHSFRTWGSLPLRCFCVRSHKSRANERIITLFIAQLVLRCSLILRSSAGYRAVFSLVMVIRETASSVT